MKSFSIFVGVFLLVFLSGCIIKNSPAPGCIKYWPVRPIGGCFSRFAIINTRIEPPIDCIKLEINNCNPPLKIRLINNCKEDVYVQGEKIPYEVESCYIPLQIYYLAKDLQGNVVLTESRVCLKRNENVSVTGFVGEEQFKVSCVLEDGKIKNKESHISSKYQKCLRTICIGGSCPTFRIEFNCNESIKIGNQIIGPKPIRCDKYPGSRIIALHEVAPSRDKNYTISGYIGEKNFTIFYTLTKQLC